MIEALLPGDIVSVRAYNETCRVKVAVVANRVMQSSGDLERIGFFMKMQPEDGKNFSIGIPVRVWSEERDE